jgi:hydroxymethylbilane synthase
MLIIGTRRSQLAIWQAEYVAQQLAAFGVETRLHFVTTQGDRVIDRPLPEIGGKGLFTEELETALRDATIDLAVHSLKDLPTQLDEVFALGAIPPRENPFDALISRSGHDLAGLPRGAVIGTSSLRRVAQIKALRPDLQTESLRGNVPTRLDKARDPESPYAAIILAFAGLKRLGLEAGITQILPLDQMLPAPAQGAIGIQCRTADSATREILTKLDHTPTRIAVTAERAFLNRLDSGCKLPVAALATLDGSRIELTGRVCSLDGSQVITIREVGDSPLDLGNRLADQALAQGAGELLNRVKETLNENSSAGG